MRSTGVRQKLSIRKFIGKASITLLTTAEKQRVLAALEFDPDAGDVVSLVECLQTPMELHQFVLNYNPNDGLLPLWSIIKNPKCDQGTALNIYWLLADFAMNREAYTDRTESDWDGVSLINEIETRFTKRFYTIHDILFVPLNFLGWSTTKVKLIKHQCGGTLPFPEIMLEPCLGESVPQETM